MSFLPTLAELEAAAEQVHAVLPPTPQIAWPLLSERVGAEVWVKHENHQPIGAFKVRGGIMFLSDLKRRQPDAAGVITATRGNHGQSVAYAARRLGLAAVIVVPHGNAEGKNRAMKAFGAELIEDGHDYQAAAEFASGLAAERKLHWVPGYDPLLIRGVGTYALELFRAAPPLDVVYVPIGLGSGISGVISARDALGLKTAVVGVVAENAPMYALSLAAGHPVSTNSADTLADGLACRTPDERAFEVLRKGVERIVTVSETAILSAMRHFLTDTHNLAEGAGAAPLAAALQERDRLRGKRVGLICSGGNVDPELLVQVIAQAA